MTKVQNEPWEKGLEWHKVTQTCDKYPAKSKPCTKFMYCMKLCEASNNLQILIQISSLILFYYVDKCCL